MRHFIWQTVAALAFFLTACDRQEGVVENVAVDDLPAVADTMEVELPFRRRTLTADDITLTKEFLYDKYTLEDTYPDQDTVRSFKWDIVRLCLAFIENMQLEPHCWAVVQNYKNLNGEAALVPGM